jgi:hypothetical protein
MSSRMRTVNYHTFFSDDSGVSGRVEEFGLKKPDGHQISNDAVGCFVSCASQECVLRRTRRGTR